MNAELIYDIFTETKKVRQEDPTAPGLHAGIGSIIAMNRWPAGEDDRKYRIFVGTHYNPLVNAFKVSHDEFIRVCEDCIKADEAREPADQAPTT